jgi:hypothetical protein
VIKASPGQNLLALLLLIGVVAALGIRLWMTAQLGLLWGPTHLAASDDALYVNFDDSLYRLNADGTLAADIPLSALGVKGPLADIQVLRNGDLMLGDLERRAIRRCTMTARICRDVAPAAADAIKRQFKFFADERSGQLYIADTRRHRVLVQPLAGGELRELAGRDALKFPNELRVHESGTVYVADTNHHRIVGLTSDGDESGLVLVAHNEVVRDGHTWPVSFTRGSLANWWVLSADGRLENADLVVYDESGVPLRRIDLPEGADPVFVTSWDEELVISDRALFQLYRVDPRSGDVFAFDSPHLERLLADARERKRQFQTFSTGALVLLGLIVIAGLALGASVLQANQRARHRVRSPSLPLATSASRYQNVYWLPLQPQAIKFIKTLKRQLWLAGVGVVILTVASVIALAILDKDKLELLRKCDPGTLKLIGLLAGYLLVTASVIVVLGFRAIASRIGSDGKMLYFADHANRIAQLAPEDAVYSKRMVAFRSLAVPLKLGNGQALYAESDLQQHIQPLLDRGQKLGEINLMIYQLIHRHPPTIWILILLAAGLVLLVGTDAGKMLF